MTFTVGRDSSTYRKRFAKCFCFPPKYRRGKSSLSRPQSVIPVLVLVLVFIAKGRYLFGRSLHSCVSIWICYSDYSGRLYESLVRLHCVEVLAFRQFLKVLLFVYVREARGTCQKLAGGRGVGILNLGSEIR